jgi:hypothetical protein
VSKRKGTNRSRQQQARDLGTRAGRELAGEARAALAAMTPADLEHALREILAQIPAVGAGATATAGKAPAREGPGPARSLLAAHGAILAPFGWMAAADVVMLTARAALAAHGPGAGVAAFTAVTTVTAAGIRTLVRLYRTPRPPRSRPSRRVRRRALAAWTAASGWIAAAIWITPAGPYALVQITLILGGLWLGRDHLYHHRQQPRPRAIVRGTVAPAALPAGPDPRLERFRARFVDRAGGRAHAPLAGAELYSFTEVRDGAGFSFEVKLDEAAGHTHSTVANQRQAIAALYDVPADQVIVAHGPRRSECRAQVTVLTAQDAYGQVQVWDGQSTYDPATGCIDFGLFGDGTTAHWRLNAPASGTWGGMILGVGGTGKTGDAHVIASEAGIAMTCTRCGAARPADGTCPQCDPRRIFAVIMGDPQRQPFSVWKGRADLTGWGPAGCVHLLRMMHRAMEYRAAAMGTEEWTDAKGRVSTGRGWFDPAPARPGLCAIFDEWHKIVGGPDGAEAERLAEDIEAEGRKVGVSISWLDQMPDAGRTNSDRIVRELAKGFNVVGHRLDGTSKSMAGLEGKVGDLPEGTDMYGIGYIGGYDGRSATTFRTKNLPETADPGCIDVRDMADRIAAMPVTFDEPVLRAFREFGFTGRCQVIDDGDVAAWRKTQQRKQAAGRPAGPVPGQAPPGAGPVSTETLDHVARALLAHVREHGGQGAELYDVMQATGLAAGPAGRALAALAASGRARQAGPGTWIPAQALEGATV